MLLLKDGPAQQAVHNPSRCDGHSQCSYKRVSLVGWLQTGFSRKRVPKFWNLVACVPLTAFAMSGEGCLLEEVGGALATDALEVCFQVNSIRYALSIFSFLIHGMSWNRVACNANTMKRAFWPSIIPCHWNSLTRGRCLVFFKRRACFVKKVMHAWRCCIDEYPNSHCRICGRDNRLLYSYVPVNDQTNSCTVWGWVW